MKPIVMLALAIAALSPGMGEPARAAESAPAETVVEESLEGQRYVAIGSSYAAGPMLPPPKPGGPARCGQSLSNYPTLLAERFGMTLIDRSCSGATTDHVLGPWGDIPPQIASITPATRLVTLTIGGNDLSYIGNLFSATCAFRARALETSVAKPVACGGVKVPTEADYARDEAQLDEIARRIRAAAPQARLVFVQYLTPLPPAGALCPATPVSEQDAAIVREIGHRLARITAQVAQVNNALVVEMNQASANHTPCDPEPWMIGAPPGYDGRHGLQWHLNKAGMQATADTIAYWLVKSGVKPAQPNMPVRLTLPAPAPVLLSPPKPAPTGTAKKAYRNLSPRAAAP